MIGRPLHVRVASQRVDAARPRHALRPRYPRATATRRRLGCSACRACVAWCPWRRGSFRPDPAWRSSKLNCFQHSSCSKLLFGRARRFRRPGPKVYRSKCRFMSWKTQLGSASAGSCFTRPAAVALEPPMLASVASFFDGAEAAVASYERNSGSTRKPAFGTSSVASCNRRIAIRSRSMAVCAIRRAGSGADVGARLVQDRPRLQIGHGCEVRVKRGSTEISLAPLALCLADPVHGDRGGVLRPRSSRSPGCGAVGVGQVDPVVGHRSRASNEAASPAHRRAVGGTPGPGVRGRRCRSPGQRAKGHSCQRCNTLRY